MPNSPIDRTAPTIGCFASSALQQLRHQLAGLLRLRDQVVVFIDLQRGERRGARERVAVVGEPAVENLLVEMIGDARAACRRAPSGT